MRLAEHSFAHDGEYILILEEVDRYLAPREGMVVAVGEGDECAYYRVTSVGGDTITAVPYINVSR